MVTNNPWGSNMFVKGCHEERFDLTNRSSHTFTVNLTILMLFTLSALPFIAAKHGNNITQSGSIYGCFSNRVMLYVINNLMKCMKT
jgi:hypothetical protein